MWLTNPRRPTIIGCTNDLRPLADMKNIVIIPFRSTFTRNSDRINPNTYVYSTDNIINNYDFFDKHRFAFMQILRDHNESSS